MVVGIAPGNHHRFHLVFAQTVHLSETETNSTICPVRWFQRIVPIRKIHIHGTDFHAMLAGIPHNLRGRIEAHGLAVQQRCAENIRMMPL